MKAKLSQCYERAFEALLTKKYAGWRLVHGIVAGEGALDGINYPHAWLENAHTVWDPNRDTDFPRGFYYFAGDIRDALTYTSTQALSNSVAFENYGPWTQEHWELAEELAVRFGHRKSQRKWKGKK